MSTHTVNSPLKHDAEDYEIGDTVTMKAEQAELLIQQGVLGPAPGHAPADKMTVAELMEALAKLEVDIPRGTKRTDLVKLYDNAVSAKDDNGNPE